MSHFENAVPRRGVVGKHKKGDPVSDEAREHAIAFGQALENALADARTIFFPDDKISGEEQARPFNVKVTFEASGRIWNPGVVDDYKAILTELP